MNSRIVIPCNNDKAALVELVASKDWLYDIMSKAQVAKRSKKQWEDEVGLTGTDNLEERRSKELDVKLNMEEEEIVHQSIDLVHSLLENLIFLQSNAKRQEQIEKIVS